jgi:hypothetical protein
VYARQEQGAATADIALLVSSDIAYQNPSKNTTASWLRLLRLQLLSYLTQEAVNGISSEADLLQHFGLSSNDIITETGEKTIINFLSQFLRRFFLV